MKIIEIQNVCSDLRLYGAHCGIHRWQSSELIHHCRGFSLKILFFKLIIIQLVQSTKECPLLLLVLFCIVDGKIVNRATVEQIVENLGMKMLFL